MTGAVTQLTMTMRVACVDAYSIESAARTMENLREFDLSTIDRAFTNVGWSCLDCGDVVQSVLEAKHHMEICDLFDRYDKNNDGSITFEEYLSKRVERLSIIS